MTVARLPALILLLGSAGCVSIRPLSDPARYIAESSPAAVYVTHNNGALLTISHPRVSGDSLLGTWQATSQQVALPLNHFRRIAAVQRDKGRTTMLIASLSIITVSMGYLITRPTAGALQPCNFEGATQKQGCEWDDP
jgi:hypothetical protein